jgi:4-hydroxyproline epimerase
VKHISDRGLLPASVRVIDSHTEGEPTRVVVEGWPTPEGDTMAGRREFMRDHHDTLRNAVVREPRGHDAIVGALLTGPVNDGSTAGVVFFNNVGYLGMCGHGLIGVVRTLQFVGELTAGTVQIDTPVGIVTATLAEDGAVTVRNVPATCFARDVEVEVPGLGTVVGDIAYGGNWFFLTELPDLEPTPQNLEPLRIATLAIREALERKGVTGENLAQIDHIEIFGKPSGSEADSRSYVMCPGGAYDRSPCGTGTSAKLAVLHARGKLAPGQIWRQQSVIGGLFDAWLEQEGGKLIPYIRGRAYVTGEASLRFDPSDPFRGGFAGA